MDTQAPIAPVRPLARRTLEAALDAIPTFAAVVRSDGTLQFANRALAQACKPGSKRRATPPTLDAFLPAGAAARLLALEASEGRTPLNRTGGATLLVEWQSCALPGDDGLVLVTGRDVSREAGLEDYIVSNQWFETAAALSGGLAHEFNNVLAAILGLAEIISMRLPAESPLQTFTAKLGTTVDRAKTFVRRFSQFSRKSAGIVESQPTAMVLSEVATTILGFLPGNVSFRTNLDPETPWCHADRHALEHVLLNCANFLRSRLRHDGGTVLLSCRPSSTGGRALIQLTGAGQALLGLNLERLFELDLGQSSTAYDSGTGLFTARNLAGRAGGSLLLRRDDPRTITFSLELPLAE